MTPGAIEITGSTTTQTGNIAESTPSNPKSRAQPEHEEYQYLDLIRTILDEGEHRPDRYVAHRVGIRQLSLKITISAPAQALTPSSPRVNSASHSQHPPALQPPQNQL